jgi:ATP phosphoribosyltransferase
VSSEPNEKLILAIPKGRILKEAAPVFARAGIEPEAAFADPDARQLRFATNHADLDIIRVRSFDVATFVAFGAAHLGIAGADVLMEFDYSEIYAPIDLGIGKCRLAVAEPAEMASSDDPRRWSHVRIATKYPEVTRKHFAARGVQAECVKLSGAMELAPSLGSATASSIWSIRAGRSGTMAWSRSSKSPTSLRASSSIGPRSRRSRSGSVAGSTASERSPVLPLRLDAAAPGFERDFQAFLGRNRDADENVDRVVADIVADVRARGDAALLDYTRKFDRFETDAAGLRVSEAERSAAAAKVPSVQREALVFAAKRIEAFHRALLPKDVDFTDATGTRLGARYRPVDAAGVYVPGGTAAYPSSVLMNIVPAKVAGVRRIVMAVPTPDGVLNPLVMLAAGIAGADEIWRIGGAQAVAALAYGTQSIKPVDKITGPGNAYVAAAKRRVFGQVGIDLIAGPSEILVVADAQNDPAWIAADLLSQAEHDPSSQPVLIAQDRTLPTRWRAPSRPSSRR